MKKEYNAILRMVNITPSFSGKIAYGQIYEDTKERFKSGSMIYTSKIISIEGNIILTKNTRYKVESFSGEIGKWIENNDIDLESEEDQLALKLRWF